MNAMLGAVLLSLAIDSAAPPPVCGLSANGGEDVVVLVHGLGRTHRSMRKLERALTADGYRVVNLRYPSTRNTVEESAALLGREIEGIDGSSDHRFHFVTHSMGGIVVRSYLATHPAIHAGRVVMLAPPNGGSELADLLTAIPLLRPLAGPPRGQLGTGPDGIASRLPAVDYEVGVIAGTCSINPLSLWVLPGPDDGVVRVEHAKVEGMADFLEVPGTHSFLMTRRDVIEQARSFLATGRFRRNGG